MKNKNIARAVIFLLLYSEASFGESDLDLFSMSLESLLDVKIQSSSFFEQTVSQSTGSSWVFTQQELNNSPIIFLKDVFEFYAPGMIASFSSFTGAALGVRGVAVSDNDKTLFMVDGQNLNQVSLYGYQAGMQSVLFGDIDHIEVVSGPGAILHGSGSINNLINVMPKKGSKNPGFDSSFTYGPVESLQKLEVGYGWGDDTQRDLYLYAGLAQAKGFTPDSYLELGEQAPSDIDSTRRVYEIPENYRLSGYYSSDDLEIQSQFQRIERSFNKGSGVNAQGAWRGHWQTYWASRLRYTWHLDTQRHFEFSLPVEFYDHGVQLNEAEGKKGGRENHIGLRSVYFENWKDNKIAVGVGSSLRNFDAQKQYFEKNKDLLEESLTGDLKMQEVFAEFQRQQTPKWSYLFGLRYDNINYSDFYEPEAEVTIYPKDLSSITKRIASAYQLSAHKTLKAAYQEGFRYPDVSYYLTHGVANNALQEENLQGLPDLKEETVKSVELSYIQSSTDYKHSYELNVYANQHKNTLGWVYYSSEDLGMDRYTVARNAIGWGPGAYANAEGEFLAYGLELIGFWTPDTKTKLRASYSYARPSSVSQKSNDMMNLVNTSGEWANYPEHIVKFTMNRLIFNNTNVNLTTYFSPKVDICVRECEPPHTASENFHRQDRLRFNASVHYISKQNFELYFIVQNIFENDGPPVGYDTRDGTGREGGLGDNQRRAYVKLAMDF